MVTSRPSHNKQNYYRHKQQARSIGRPERHLFLIVPVDAFAIPFAVGRTLCEHIPTALVTDKAVPVAVTTTQEMTSSTAPIARRRNKRSPGATKNDPTTIYYYKDRAGPPSESAVGSFGEQEQEHRAPSATVAPADEREETATRGRTDVDSDKDESPISVILDDDTTSEATRSGGQEKQPLVAEISPPAGEREATHSSPATRGRADVDGDSPLFSGGQVEQPAVGPPPAGEKEPFVTTAVRICLLVVLYVVQWLRFLGEMLTLLLEEESPPTGEEEYFSENFIAAAMVRMCLLVVLYVVEWLRCLDEMLTLLLEEYRKSIN